MRQSFILLLVLALLAKDIAAADNTIPTNEKFHTCKVRECAGSSTCVSDLET